MGLCSNCDMGFCWLCSNGFLLVVVVKFVGLVVSRGCHRWFGPRPWVMVVVLGYFFAWLAG